jgi:hypothetical protein
VEVNRKTWDAVENTESEAGGFFSSGIQVNFKLLLNPASWNLSCPWLSLRPQRLEASFTPPRLCLGLKLRDKPSRWHARKVVAPYPPQLST